MSSKQNDTSISAKFTLTQHSVKLSCWVMAVQHFTVVTEILRNYAFSTISSSSSSNLNIGSSLCALWAATTFGWRLVTFWIIGPPGVDPCDKAICLFKLDFWANLDPQTAHLKLLLPRWKIKCAFRLAWVKNCLPQIEHLFILKLEKKTREMTGTY